MPALDPKRALAGEAVRTLPEPSARELHLRVSVPPARLELPLLDPASIRDYEYRGLMEEADREVLEFIGDQGKTAEQVSDRFPAFELERLVRAELARPRRTNPVKSQSRHTPADEHTFYVLTSRGAEAIGLAPYTLHSD